MPENLVSQLSHSGVGTLVRNAIRLHEVLTHRVSGFCRASLTGREVSSNLSGLDFLVVPGCCLAVFLTARSRRFQLGSFHFTPEGCPGGNVRHLEDISNFLPVETTPAQVEHRS